MTVSKSDPAGCIEARGEWTTCVVWERRVPGFPASIDTAPGFPDVASIGDVLEVDETLRRALSTVPAGESRLVLVTFTRRDGGFALSCPSWMLSISRPPDVDRTEMISEWVGEALGSPALVQEVANLAPGEVYAVASTGVRFSRVE